MIGELIQEYLVGLGAKIDKPGFQEADRTIKAMDQGIETATGHMADNFIKASAAITTAIAGVTASVAGLMKVAADQDLAMQKLSRQMMVSKEDAYAMKQATDALGESIQDIMLTPELMGRFEKLAADGKKMRVGGDFEETMKGFRDLMFEFTRLKQEVSYAMTWVGYYLMKYLNKPLTEARDKFRSFNDAFVRNMSVWTEKAARAIVYIINIGRHLIDFAVDATKHFMSLWESFPKGVKIAIGALSALFLVMRASPFGRMIMLVSTLLLLIDDYYGYMEGKQAQFGKYWDKLNGYISIAKQKWEEFKAFAMPFWEAFIGFLSAAKDKIVEFANGVGEFINRVRNSSEMQEFLDVMERIGSAIWNLATTWIGGLLDAFDRMRTGFERTSESSGGFRGALQRLWRVLYNVLNVVADIIEFIAELQREISRTEEWQEFTEAVGELFGAFVELFNVIIDCINIAFGGLFGEMSKTDKVYSFRDAIRAVLKIFTLLIKAVTWVIKLFGNLFKMMKDSKPFREFWETLGRVIDKALVKIGKFGRALIALTKMDFKGAYNIVMGKDGGGGGGTKSDASDMDRRMWNVAKKIADENDTDPRIVYAQFGMESSWWSSRVARENNNFGGLTQNEPNGEENKQPDGGGYYMTFDSPEAYGDYWSRVWGPYVRGAKTPLEYAQRLKEQGYYDPGTTAEEYAGSIKGAMDVGVPSESASGDDTSDDYGDDLDKSKWRLWSSTQGYDTPWNSTVTDVSGFRPATKAFLNDLGNRYASIGFQGTITGASEAGYHSEGGTYSHVNGYKVDISDSDIPEGSERYQILADMVDKYGGTMNHEWNKGHYDIVIYGIPSSVVHEKATDGGSIGSYVSPDPSNSDVDPDLLAKFNDFVAGIRANGYDVYVQYAKGGSIGFTTSGDDTDPWNIKGNAEGYGLDVSQDEHGWYVSLPTAYRNMSYGIDPLLYGGLRNGMYSGGVWAPMVGGGFGGNVYNVNVGGVTVQGGANASAEDIGRAVGDETMKRLEERGQYILHSRTMSGGPVLV